MRLRRRSSRDSRLFKHIDNEIALPPDAAAAAAAASSGAEEARPAVHEGGAGSVAGSDTTGHCGPLFALRAAADKRSCSMARAQRPIGAASWTLSSERGSGYRRGLLPIARAEDRKKTSAAAGRSSKRRSRFSCSRFGRPSTGHFQGAVDEKVQRRGHYHTTTSTTTTTPSGAPMRKPPPPPPPPSEALRT